MIHIMLCLYFICYISISIWLVWLLPLIESMIQINDTIHISQFEIISLTKAKSIDMRKSYRRPTDCSDKISSCRKQIPRKLQICVAIISINSMMFMLIITQQLIRYIEGKAFARNESAFPTSMYYKL